MTRWIRHKYAPKNNGPFTCLVCNQVFHSSSGVHNHMKNKHLDPRTYACHFPCCTKKYPRFYSLQRHYEKVHELTISRQIWEAEGGEADQQKQTRKSFGNLRAFSARNARTHEEASFVGQAFPEMRSQLRQEEVPNSESGKTLRDLMFQHRVARKTLIATHASTAAIQSERDQSSSNGAESKSPIGHIDNGLTGEALTTLFVHQAANTLSTLHFRQLKDFFQEIPRIDDKDTHDKVEARVRATVNEFYKSEPELSNMDDAYLSQPSGSVSAEIGIILHCQSGLGHAGPFWNAKCATIQTLQAKGFDESFCFCYDWHWRKERSHKQRGACMTVNWPKELRDLHSELSTQLLSIIPLRFLLIGGVCAKLHYKNTTGFDRQTLSIPLPEAFLHLELDLEFSSHRLERIVAYIDHPSAAYYTNNMGFAGSCQQFDAGANLFLWLLGRAHCAAQIKSVLSKHTHLNISRKAPVASLSRYRSAEETRSVTLQEADYTPDFLEWAKRFLGQEYSEVIQARESIAEICHLEMLGRSLLIHDAKGKYSGNKKAIQAEVDRLYDEWQRKPILKRVKECEKRIKKSTAKSRAKAKQKKYKAS